MDPERLVKWPQHKSHTAAAPRGDHRKDTKAGRRVHRRREEQTKDLSYLEEEAEKEFKTTDSILYFRN